MATQNIDSMKKYLPKTKETVKLKKLLNRSAGLASCFFQTAIAAFVAVSLLHFCSTQWAGTCGVSQDTLLPFEQYANPHVSCPPLLA